MVVIFTVLIIALSPLARDYFNTVRDFEVEIRFSLIIRDELNTNIGSLHLGFSDEWLYLSHWVVH